MRIFAYLFAFIALCGVTQAAQSPQGTQGDARIEVGGVSFVVPPGWTSERINGNGVLLLAPRPEKGWQANIYVEHALDRQNRPLEKIITDIVPNLAARKHAFQELSRSVEQHPAGLELASVEYLNQSDHTALREREVVIALAGAERLFIVLSSEAGLFGKYQTAFSNFLASMSKK